MAEKLTLLQECRRLYDKLRLDGGGMSSEKRVGSINAFLGRELIMSLLIGPQGDIMSLQIRGRTVHVVDPEVWKGKKREVEGATPVEVVAFLREVEHRQRHQRMAGRRHRR